MEQPASSWRVKVLVQADLQYFPFVRFKFIGVASIYAIYSPTRWCRKVAVSAREINGQGWEGGGPNLFGLHFVRTVLST